MSTQQNINYLQQPALQNPGMRRALLMWSLPALAFAVIVCGWQIPFILSAQNGLAQEHLIAEQQRVAYDDHLATALSRPVFDERPGLQQRIALEEAVLVQLYGDRAQLPNTMEPLVRLLNVLPNSVRISTADFSNPATITASIETQNADALASAGRELERTGVITTSGDYKIGPPATWNNVVFNIAALPQITPSPSPAHPRSGKR